MSIKSSPRKLVFDYEGETFYIQHNPKPIPTKAFDWDWWSDELDGAQDAEEHKCGACRTVEECIKEIEEWECEEVTYSVAKKHYPCEASQWLNNCQIEECELTDDERLSMEGAKADNWKILPGQKYIKVRGKWEGEWQTFRARIDMDAICKRHDIYEC